jgi:hypothetical protein
MTVAFLFFYPIVFSPVSLNTQALRHGSSLKEMGGTSMTRPVSADFQLTAGL